MPTRVIWSDEARADMRAIDRNTAIRLLDSLARYLKTDSGSVKPLEGSGDPLFRLRTGNWRFIFRKKGEGAIEIVRVRNRREAYR